MKKGLLAVFALSWVLLATACPVIPSSMSDTAVVLSSVVQVGGASGIADTASLTLRFDVDPVTLSSSNIVISGATKGTLSGTGTTRSLSITDITVANGGTVSITIDSPAGYAISGSPKTVVVYRDTRTSISFLGINQIGGVSGEADTTSLTLTFDVDPVTLSANDIVLSGATKGILSGSGTTRSLAISDITVANGSTVSIAIYNPSGYAISGSPKTVVVYRDRRTPISFLNVNQIGGISEEADTMSLTLTFDVDPVTLSASDILLSGATKGILSGSGTTRNLEIYDIIVANGDAISIKIDSPSGYLISGSPKDVVVYKDTRIPISFIGMEQVGGVSGVADTASITLTFDVDPVALSVNDIVLSGATKGILSGSGTTRSLAISDITVANGSIVSITIESPSGYAISSSPKTAVVYRDIRIPVELVSIAQYAGNSGTANTTHLLLNFDANPYTLDISDITVTGAHLDDLIGLGSSRTLAISNISVENGEEVSVGIASPDGYIIDGSPKTVVVYKDTRVPVSFVSLEQTGWEAGISDSTALILSFDIEPVTLSVDDITLSGATKGSLSSDGMTRSLSISDITVGNGETITVSIANPSGYNIINATRNAVVHKAHYVGMPYQGGIIAYILQPDDPGYDANQIHGLIASTEDLSEALPWGHDNLETGANSKALGSGQANTTAIVSTTGAAGYAAKLCDDYINSDTGTGTYSDWYLPSFDELVAFFSHKDSIGGFNAGFYWSSSEVDANSAWFFEYTVGLAGNINKNLNEFRVRAVRSF